MERIQSKTIKMTHFCMVDVTKYRKVKGRQALQYPNILSSTEPVPHDDTLPVPQPPENPSFSFAARSLYDILTLLLSPQTVNKDEGGPRVPVVGGRRGPRRAQWWNVRRGQLQRCLPQDVDDYSENASADDYSEDTSVDAGPEARIFCFGFCSVNGTVGFIQKYCFSGQTAYNGFFCKCCI
ncbi:hypothetical protein FHG87_007983 [Trinorchestia longiramus]|nr:hypothetical protein FHG87_007983 [Trinorchestia longiramus]